MLKKKIIKFVLLVFIIALFIISIILVCYRCNKPKENALTFYLHRTDGLSSWSYELSAHNVLKETEYIKYDYLGHTYDYWKFEPIGSGEVTIFFVDQYQSEVTEENCFSITYYVDTSGNIKEISSENKPEKINFDDDTMGLIKLKVYDFFYYHIVKIILQIIDIFDYIL